MITDEADKDAASLEKTARMGRYNMRVEKIVQGPEDIARLKQIYADADPNVILANANVKIFTSEPSGKL